jgi:hypothetical protein
VKRGFSSFDLEGWDADGGLCTFGFDGWRDGAGLEEAGLVLADVLVLEEDGWGLRCIHCGLGSLGTDLDG